MFEQIKTKLREFIANPISTAVEWGVYLIMLAVGVAILIWMAKFAISFIY